MDIDEINEHIRKLKCEETSWQSVEKLAALCTVRDELGEKQDRPEPEKAKAEPASMYSTAATPVEPKSEFVQAASSVPFGGLMDILDQHMSAIRMVYPKEYELVMRKIKMITLQ